MSYDEDDESEGGFKTDIDDENEPLDLPEDMSGLDEDPEDRYH